MKKSLIAAAISAAVAVPAANAGVVVYGKIHASVDYLNYDYDYNDSWMVVTPIAPMEVRPFSGKGWYVANRASRIGFKGTEDLGGGLSLIWKAETTYNLSEGGDGWSGGRNAYIGLAGDWGTFLYGRHDTPMKISTGRLDLFSDQLGDYNYSPDPQNALLGPGFEDVRAANAIAYISPNWNGLTIAAAIIPGENEYEGADGLADGYSIAAMYSNNGLYLSAAYEDGEKLELNSHKKWRIGAGYTINAFTFNAVYENQDSNKTVWLEDKKDEHDLWQISAAYDFGNNRLKAAYGENKGVHTFDDYTENKKRKSWAIGLDHNLSKRTKAYVVYADVSHSADIDGGIWMVDANVGNGEQDINGFSMGLMHSF